MATQTLPDWYETRLGQYLLEKERAYLEAMPKTDICALRLTSGCGPAVVMAIYGHETSYGLVTGGFDLVQALASLAYEGRRRDFFETELIATLKLIDVGIPRWRLKGSYAGATGYPQFMPSVALRLRADGDGDGAANLWSSEDDGFASIANYLRDAGWKRGIPWGIAVRTPPEKRTEGQRLVHHQRVGDGSMRATDAWVDQEPGRPSSGRVSSYSATARTTARACWSSVTQAL